MFFLDMSDCSAACDRQMSPYDRPPKPKLRAALRTYLLHLCHVFITFSNTNHAPSVMRFYAYILLI